MKNVQAVVRSNEMTRDVFDRISSIYGGMPYSSTYAFYNKNAADFTIWTRMFQFSFFRLNKRNMLK